MHSVTRQEVKKCSPFFLKSSKIPLWSYIFHSHFEALPFLLYIYILIFYYNIKFKINLLIRNGLWVSSLGGWMGLDLTQIVHPQWPAFLYIDYEPFKGTVAQATVFHYSQPHCYDFAEMCTTQKGRPIMLRHFINLTSGAKKK